MTVKMRTPRPAGGTITAPAYQARLTERQWRDLVRETALVHRWVVLFELPDAAYRMLAEAARKTPGQAHLLPPEGWPDFVFARREGVDRARVLNVELKVNTGRPSPAQVETLDLLADSRAETYLWRPRDWAAVLEVLT